MKLLTWIFCCLFSTQCSDGHTIFHWFATPELFWSSTLTELIIFGDFLFHNKHVACGNIVLFRVVLVFIRWIHFQAKQKFYVFSLNANTHMHFKETPVLLHPIRFENVHNCFSKCCSFCQLRVVHWINQSFLIPEILITLHTLLFYWLFILISDNDWYNQKRSQNPYTLQHMKKNWNRIYGNYIIFMKWNIQRELHWKNNVLHIRAFQI